MILFFNGITIFFNTKSTKNNKESELYLQDLPVAVFTSDANGYVQTYNESAIKLWGKEPVIGEDLWCGSLKVFKTDGNPFPPEECPMNIALKEGRIIHSEIVIERPDGERRHIIPHPKVIYDKSGKIIGAINTLIDITDQVIARIKIQESETRSRLAIEAAEMGTFDWDLQNQIFLSSDRIYAIFGFQNAKNVSHQNLVDRYHPDDKSIRQKAIADSHEKGFLFYEARIIWVDKSVHWIKVYGKVIYNENAKPIRMFGTVSDISKHKNFAEELEQNIKLRTEQLREQNDFIQTLLDSSIDSIMVIDKNFRVISLNKTANTLFEPYFKESIIGKTLEEIDPDTKKKPGHLDLLESFKGNPVFRKDVKSQTEERYFDIYYVPLANETEIYAVMLILRDVTETAISRQAIEKSNNILKARNEFIETIIDSSHEWILVYDKDMTLLTVNKACENMLSLKREEVVGKKMFEIFPLSKNSKAESDLIKALNGEYIENETFYSSITGRFIQNYYTPLHDENGVIYAVLVFAQDMTKTKQVEEEIKKANFHLVEAQRLAKIGSWDWNVIENEIAWSEELCKIFDIDSKYLKNDFTNYITHVHPDDKELVIQSLKSLRESKLSYDFFHRIIYSDGSIRSIRSKGAAFANSNKDVIRLSGTVQDVTETVEMESKLRNSEMRNHLMNEQVEDYAIIFLNPEGYIEEWSLGAEKIKGYIESEAIGLHFSTFYTDEDRANNIPKKILNEARLNKKAFYEGWRVRKDKTQFWASVLITSLVDEDNNCTGFSKLTRDLSEQKNAEEEIKMHSQKVIIQNQELEKINFDLEKTNKELASFSYVASHDLQEPLRKIVTFSTRLQEKYRESLPDDMKFYLDKIENSSIRMTRLIQDLLNYTRLINHDKLFEKTNLNTVLQNILDDFELLIEQKGAKIESDKLPIIEAIPLHMGQLFYNLISNALKFSKVGVPPIITITSRKLSVEEILKFPSLLNLKVAKEYHEIVFKDNGIGFEKKYAEQIFIIFQRLHAKTEYTGTGIGLALSRKLVENLHGEIFCEVKENEGAEFHVILPLKQPKA